MTPKGLPFDADRGVGWSLFDGDVPFPVAIVKESAIVHNGAVMRSYCERSGVSLAPHGKTTMSPGLFHRQLDDGAWAITAATVWQAAAMRSAGVGRVFIANEVVVPAEVAWLGRAVDDGFEAWCYVDSVDGVGIMDDALAAAGTVAQVRVVVEVGAPGGRAGVRTLEDGLAVAEAAHRAPRLALTGISGFEGILGATGDRSAAEVVGEFLDRIVDLAHHVAAAGWFQPTPEVIVTAGGSAYFDYVVDRFDALSIDLPLRKVIRSGCYITHDDGGYHRSSPMGATPRVGGDRFVPAIEVWGAVVSRPEPTRAIVGLGKRDANHEGILPVAKKVLRRGSGVVEDVEPNRAALMNDQHTFLDVDAEDPLAVGDLLGFGVSHPCLNFDKWRSLLLVDDDYRVVEVLDTMF